MTQKSARLGCVKMVQLTVSEQLTHNGGLKCENVEFLKPLIAVGVYIFIFGPFNSAAAAGAF